MTLGRAAIEPHTRHDVYADPADLARNIPDEQPALDRTRSATEPTPRAPRPSSSCPDNGLWVDARRTPFMQSAFPHSNAASFHATHRLKRTQRRHAVGSYREPSVSRWYLQAVLHEQFPDRDPSWLWVKGQDMWQRTTRA
jgi:hypothetical protein